MLTLSICIPSYNRFERLKKTIFNILKCKSDDFEIVVVDYCSSSDISKVINVEDKRLKIIKRDKPVDGTTNVNTCIMYGKGKYSLLLLDKDIIIGDKLSEFIETLNRNDVFGGYCVINSNANNEEIYTENALEKFGFLSKHPSGNFYKMDMLKNYVNQKKEKILLNPFGFDIWLTYCAQLGNMLLYDRPLIKSSLSKIDKNDKKSFTYSVKNDNIYYFPKNRIEQFMMYFECLFSYKIGRLRKIKNVFKLYYRTLGQISIQYKSIMADEKVCSHYGHATKHVTMKEINENIFRLRKKFLKEKNSGMKYNEKFIVILISELLVKLYMILKL